MVSLLRLQGIILSIVLLTLFLTSGSSASPVSAKEDYTKIQETFRKSFPSVPLAPYGSIVDKVSHYITRYKDFLQSHTSRSDPEEVKSFNETLKQFHLALELCDGIGKLLKDAEGNCDSSDRYDLSGSTLREAPSSPGGEKQLILSTPTYKYKGGTCRSSDGSAGANFQQVTSESEASVLEGALSRVSERQNIKHSARAYSHRDNAAEKRRSASSVLSATGHKLLSHLISSGGRGFRVSTATRQAEDAMNLALGALSQAGITSPDLEAVVQGAPTTFASFLSERQCAGGRSRSMPQGLDVISSLDFSLPEELLHQLKNAGILTSDKQPNTSGALVLSMRTDDSETLMAKLSEGIIAREGPRGKIRNEVCAFTDNAEAFTGMASIAERALTVMGEALFNQLTNASTTGQPPVEKEPAKSSSSDTASPPAQDNRDLSSDQTAESPKGSATSTTSTQPPTPESAATSAGGGAAAAAAPAEATPSANGAESTTPTTGGPTTTGSPSERTAEAACFPGDATVELEDGARVPMRDLRVGDSVRSSRSAFSKVILFTHADGTADAEFVLIRTETSSRGIALSRGHYLPSYREGQGWKLVAAGSVRAGDLVVSGEAEAGVDGHVAVTAVTRTRAAGLFNPQTVSGGIVVNGVYASTYTTAVPVALARALLTPLSVASEVFGVVFPSLSATFRGGAAGLAGLVPEGSRRLDL